MAGRIRIEPYRPLDINTSPVPGGGYIRVDASAGRFGPSPLTQLGLQAAEGAAAIAAVAAHHFATDNEAVVKAADTRLSEAEQALLFDPQTGYLNRQGQDALTQAPAEAYRAAQDRELAATANDDQHQMLRQLNERRLTSFNTVVERHGAAERLRWHDEASDGRIALMRADAALHWSDDALLRRALGTVRAEVREKAGRHAWNAESTDSALRRQTSRTLASAITAAVDHDPERAQDLRTRYDHHIEPSDRAPLDAMLAEAQVRARAQRASAEILNTTPPDGGAPTLPWQLQQAEAIAEPAVRTATLRTLRAAAAAADARARTLAEQVLAHVLQDGLTDVSQIPVKEWVALDPDRRRAIQTRIDHNAAGTEPPANPALVDELATQMTEAPGVFAHRDLVPSVAHLPLPQWQRFRDLQAGIQRDAPLTKGEVYAIKRSLQLATKILPAHSPDAVTTKYHADVVEEIDTWRRINGKSPDDADIVEMLKRRVLTEPYVSQTLEGDPRQRATSHNIQAGLDSTTYAPGPSLLRRIFEMAIALEARRALGEAIRSMPKGVLDDTKAVAAVTGLTLADGYPSRIRPNGEDVYFNPQTGRYLVRNKRKGPGYWAEFDARGEFFGVIGDTLVSGTPRDQLSPEQVKEWTQPETFPIADPLPPIPGFEPTSPPKWQEGFTVVAPPPPLPGFSFPELEIPTYVEAEDQEHHQMPQYLWNPRRRRNPTWKPKYTFSPDAIRVFKGLTVRIPNSQHWGQLHAAYNREVARHLQTYLEKKAAEHRVTIEDYTASMNEDQARECAKAVEKAIRNPVYTQHRSEREIDDAKFAKEFLDRTTLYQQDKSGTQKPNR